MQAAIVSSTSDTPSESTSPVPKCTLTASFWQGALCIRTRGLRIWYPCSEFPIRNSCGLTKLEVLLVAICIFVVVSQVVQWGLYERAGEARRNIPESIREGDAAKVIRGLRTTTDADLPIFEDWTLADGTSTVMQYSLVAYAAKHRQLEVVKALIEYGSEIDGTVWGNGRQPLYWAAYHQDEALYDLLIGAGASSDAIVDAKTPLGHANEGYPEAAAFLKANGVEH